ncbi:hypothetical protein [Nakamurella endophytica]|uniref:N-terminal of MaoC-like dehydratase domain-containing protein n=1 Tax=Nakamurella endophytica TaxID=1748367 RepID=A0A917WE61_9ACTN|nr:hypothetical protein [Nakamurella endophytica]GGL94651.1 hypothetical protein GCM10011594_13090 [Nakamurella endophytica]
MTLPDIDELRERLVGHPFPGGSFRVAEYERWLSHDAMRSPALAAPLLHPVWILLGALRGMGISIDELTGLAGAGAHDGTVFGETEMEQRRPLRADVEYTVRGGVADLVRRVGRRAGTMDLLTFRLEIVEPTGEVAAVSSQTFVFPRRDADA